MNRDDVMRETLQHKLRVADLMMQAATELMRRAIHHDDSKFGPREFEQFAESTAKLKGLTYGTDEYKEALKELGPALQHHYEHNSHHPEHYVGGIHCMDLFDLIEMLLDWKAAGERHEDGSLEKSLTHNRERFDIPEAIEQLLRNTIESMRLDDDE